MKNAFLAIVASAVIVAGCVTMGRDFPVEAVGRITQGKTTRDEIRATFSEPVQRGIENGKETWTYYRIRYRGARKTRSKELHVVFDEHGTVESYSFTTTDPLTP